MLRKREEERGFGSCRVRRTAQAIIARNSKVPSDFFSGKKLASQRLPRTRSRDISCEQEDRKAFQEFVGMFKMGKSLKQLAIRLKPSEDTIQDFVYEPACNKLRIPSNKENGELMLPSLHHRPSKLPFKSYIKFQKQKTLQK